MQQNNKPPLIPPLIITSFEAISHFKANHGGYGGENERVPYTGDFLENTRHNFKMAAKQDQIKILFAYILSKSEDGKYKKEDNRKIGEYFDVGRDLIKNRFRQLIEDGYITEIEEMNRFYKINIGM